MKKNRIESIDLLRGIVMIIMALDHVRDYFNADAFYFDPLDLEKTSPAFFFTRFITHYCAAVFVFLSGSSAFFVSLRKTKNELSSFLFKRGLWLIFIECTLVTFAWTFNPSGNLAALQVIWAIGFSMIVLGVLVHLPRFWILITGVLLIFGHNTLDALHFDHPVWKLLHERGIFFIGEWKVIVAYPVIPWIGLMALGYCTGIIYKNDFPAIYRKRILNSIGVSALILFVILRYTNVYGDPAPWLKQETSDISLLSFFNVTKYPPSLLFLLITVGPGLIFLANSEKIKNKLSDIIITIGRVPFFYYILHLYFIHFFAMIAAQYQGYGWDSMILTKQVNKNADLIGYGFNLTTTYIFWILLVIMLYPFCRWYNNYKTNHPEKWWLSYL